MTLPLFYVDRLVPAAGTVVLDGAEGRHAADVRRIRLGERVRISDGAGAFAVGEVVSVGKGVLTVDVGPVEDVRQPEPRIVAVQALPKGERADLAVAMLTEVGVDEIVPWEAANCVVRWDATRRERGQAKWQSVAREAAKQARRARIPLVSRVVDTEGLAERLAAADSRVVLHEAANASITDVTVPSSGELLLVIGPEGGLSPSELATFEGLGVEPVRLGPEVLRTSTAGPVAVGVLLSRSGRWSVANTI